MQKFALCAALFALAFVVVACGPDSEDLDPVSWPFLEKKQDLKINGTDFKAFIAKTRAERQRALNGLAIGKEEAIALLYPESDQPIDVKFGNVPDALDLVLLDASGKALHVESVPAHSSSIFNKSWSHKDMRVVLQLPAGKAKELKIVNGGRVETAPSLTDAAKDAGGEQATLWFVGNPQPEDKPEDAPSVNLTILEKVEDIAQGAKDREFKDGEGVLINCNREFHHFWMKGVTGKWNACYVARPTRGRHEVVIAMYENIEDTGATDLERPIYNSPDTAQWLAIFKGEDYFKKNDITRRSRVFLSGPQYQVESVDLSKFEFEIGDKTFNARVAQTEQARKEAIVNAADLRQNELVVLAWDDSSHVSIAGLKSGANVWFIGADWKVAKKTTANGEADSFKATSRFAVVVPAGTTGDTIVPYVVRDLMPTLPAIAFYDVPKKEIVKDRWPTAKENLKGIAHVEIARTNAEQTRGLMGRESLRKDHGMIFIYDGDDSEVLSYWMKNCKMNLSIAFVSDQGVIVKIHNSMKKPDPSTPDYALPRYSSESVAKYAIEMDENWFKEHGVEEGHRVYIPKDILSK
ncbi:MAG: DUF192 domain-containing protein [Planctomycetota bacterium]|jgi:uncharacterized membrane protein (UPF0127 family)